MALATLSIDLEAKLANLERDFNKASRLAEQNANRIKSSYSDLNGTFETLGASIAAAFGVNFFVGLIQNSIDAQDKLNDLSKSTSLTIETLSGLSLAADKSGTDIEGVSEAVSKLAENMGKESKKFANLGITAKDPLEAFKQLSDIFVAIEDPQKRAAFAAEALGKSWKSAAPLLAEGSASIGLMVERGQKLSNITNETAEQADKFNDQLAELKASAGGAATAFANNLVPSLTDTAKAMTDAAEKGNILWALIRGMAGIGKLPFDLIFDAKSMGLDSSIETQIKDLGNELLKLEGQAKQVANGGILQKFMYGSTDELNQKITVTRNQLDALEKYKERLNKPAPSENNQNAPSNSALDSFIGGEKKTGKQSDDYSSLIRQLNEKVTLQTADLNSLEALTTAQKDYAKYQADIASGAIVLTAEQKKVAEAFFEVYQERSKQNELEKATTKADSIVADYTQGNALIVERIERESELALMTERQRAIAEAVYRTEDEGSAIRERIIRDIQDETAQKIALAKAEEELAIQKGKVADITAKSYDQQQTFQFGWTKAFRAYSDSASNAAKQAQDVFDRAASSMEDALTQFAMTGKISFSSLATSIIADIVRMQARAATSGIMSSIGKLVGSYFSSGTSSSVAPVASAKGNVFAMPSLSAYSGTVVNQPTFFANGGNVMGEAGPEGIFPLKRGKDGKLGVAAEGSGVTVNVINNSGSQATTSERKDGKGNRIIEVLIEQTKNAIASDISSGNGSVPAAMAGAFGLKRTAGAY